MNKQHELITQYRGQIALKTDLLKGKTEELKRKEKDYKTGIESVKKKLEDKHNADIETIKNTYNELLYTSERKYKKLEKAQSSYYSYFF